MSKVYKQGTTKAYNRLPKEVTEFWESQLRDVTKNKSYKELSFDPDVLSNIIQRKQGQMIKRVDPMVLRALYQVFEQLPKRQREILTLYFGLSRQKPMTLEEIGKELGITHQSASIIMRRGLTQLRKRIALILLVKPTKE